MIARGQEEMMRGWLDIRKPTRRQGEIKKINGMQINADQHLDDSIFIVRSKNTESQDKGVSRKAAKSQRKRESSEATDD
jgi:hypothetical protein